MKLKVKDLTEQDIQESCERMMSSGPVVTDMSDYYADKLYGIHQKHIVQEEKTILGIPVPEIERQCQANDITRIRSFTPPLRPSQDPLDIVIQGGEEILNDPDTLELVRRIYSSGNIRKH